MQARCLNIRAMPASRVAGQQRASARAPLRVAFEQQRSLVKVFAEAEEAKEQEVVPEVSTPVIHGGKRLLLDR